MGFFKTIARWIGNIGSVSGKYAGIKDVFGKIYDGASSVVHTVGNIVDKVDGFIQNVKQKNIPLVSDLATAVQSNPIYGSILRGSKYAQEAVDTAGEIGRTIDGAISPLVSDADYVIKRAKEIGNSS
jgi:hypothetical protein